MDLVSCSKCGRIHTRGTKCTAYKRIYNKTDTDKLRNKSKWRDKASQVKEEACYLCEVCKRERVFTYNKLEVHHITKLKEDPGGLLDDYNLICLCITHHKKADAGEIPADYLRQLARERIEKAQEQRGI
jgi:5-methylcytosine-specific restriction endonuclease McrA